MESQKGYLKGNSITKAVKTTSKSHIISWARFCYPWKVKDSKCCTMCQHLSIMGNDHFLPTEEAEMVECKCGDANGIDSAFPNNKGRVKSPKYFTVQKSECL